jgi:predicted Fe-Mo cluster-binding NifX family protein
MNIAVTSQNFRTITGHAGKARRFLVYQTDANGDPQEIERLDLPKDQCFHEWHGRDDEPHPADIADVIITAGCGGGFAQRMAKRGIRLETTAETDPKQAVRLFLVGQLPPATETEHDHHDHHHEHTHEDDDCGCGN